MSPKFQIMMMLVMLMMAKMSLGKSQQNESEESGELDSYGSAGSEDIYIVDDSNGDVKIYYDDEDASDSDANDDDYLAALDQAKDLSEEELERQLAQLEKERAVSATGHNLEARGESEISCEYSCPRYYRPVCVSRNGAPVTYGTPCEYFNQLRCANVARNAGKPNTPNFKLLYHDACREE